ncbi:hypothetical protein N665_0753s0011 [Sinapis alba]|nr:hypothetical protein N665_0753s0011 [Sinapis alba]
MISDSIPIELNLEILSIPSKSIARFRCMSKQWESKLGIPYFKDLFLAKSLSQQRLLFGIEEKNLWSIFSLPENLSPHEKLSSSLAVTPEFHMKFPPDGIRIHHSGQAFACGYC